MLPPLPRPGAEPAQPPPLQNRLVAEMQQQEIGPSRVERTVQVKTMQAQVKLRGDGETNDDRNEIDFDSDVMHGGQRLTKENMKNYRIYFSSATF